MDLVDLVDHNFGINQDNFSMGCPDINGLDVIGWSGRCSSSKIYIVKCRICSLDPELFGEGYFKTTRYNIETKSCKPCGCSKATRWSKEQYAILCSRKAESLGYKFLGFSQNWDSHRTKVILHCNVHGSWTTSNITSIINKGVGCPACCIDNLKRPEDEWIQLFTSMEVFHKDTVFEREEYSGCWKVFCPECGESVKSLTENLSRGRIPCGCSPHRQKIAYINKVLDDGNLLALKIGIAVNPDKRVKDQNLKSLYTIEKYFNFLFPTVEACKAAEKFCLKELYFGILTKEEMPDGWTETTYTENLSQIMEIYKRFGGVLLL